MHNATLAMMQLIPKYKTILGNWSVEHTPTRVLVEVWQVFLHF